MSLLVDGLSWILLMIGSAFVFIGGVGLLRFPDFFSRLHAASVTDTAGLGFITLGLLLQAGFSMASVKLLFILLFMVFTGPTATHALAKAALHGNLRPTTDDEREATGPARQEGGSSNT